MDHVTLGLRSGYGYHYVGPSHTPVLHGVCLTVTIYLGSAVLAEVCTVCTLLSAVLAKICVQICVSFL